MRCTAEIRQDNAEEIGYCQPDGRHSADPRVPFALPATSKPSREPSSFYILRSISRLGSHPRVLSTGILDSRKYFKPTPRYSSPLLFTLNIESIRQIKMRLILLVGAKIEFSYRRLREIAFLFIEKVSSEKDIEKKILSIIIDIFFLILQVPFFYIPLESVSWKCCRKTRGYTRKRIPPAFPPPPRFLCYPSASTFSLWLESIFLKDRERAKECANDSTSGTCTGRKERMGERKKERKEERKEERKKERKKERTEKRPLVHPCSATHLRPCHSPPLPA